ncbi:MAG TPA: queuosine precursor transporter [Candidatus Limnocylindria bacterium]|nr:queuosine precursor transporter [Candidatus Limnocylindria bacterium]
MTLSLFVFWAIVVSLLTTVAAFYAKRYHRSDALIVLYVTLILFANITASKIIMFDLGFTPIFAPAAVLIFAVTFLLTDIVNEKFGRAETQRMIFIAFCSQIVLILFSYLIVHATSAPFFTNQAAFEAVFGYVPRIVFASLAAFLISENADAYIFAWFKNKTQGKHLWMRNAFSSLPSMILDSTVFITLAFYGGAVPILGLIIGQTTIKWLIGIIDIPFMYLAKSVMKD